MIKLLGLDKTTVADITDIYQRNVDTVYRLCYSFLGASEAEDATQAVFMKLIEKPREFNDEKHEKGWLIVTASNLCKDVLKSARVAKAGQMPADVVDRGASSEMNETTDAILRLPDHLKECVLLHYYEGYRSGEIGEMLDIPASTVRNHLAEARKLLKETLEGGTR